MDDNVNLEHRLTEVEDRTKSNTHRLDRLEPIVEEIRTISETLIEMSTEMKHTTATVQDIKSKVEVLEKEPGKKWNDSTKAVFNAFLGAIGAAIAAGLIYLLTMVH